MLVPTAPHLQAASHPGPCRDRILPGGSSVQCSVPHAGIHISRQQKPGLGMLEGTTRKHLFFQGAPGCLERSLETLRSMLFNVGSQQSM